MNRRRLMTAGVALLTWLGLSAMTPATASTRAGGAASYELIIGSGSTWAGNAINEWIANLAADGIQVVYTADGSDAGRANYIADVTDFAASDLPFRHGQDKLGGVSPEHVPWGYSYIPDVAGGTAFMYHLNVRGHLITNLRLSGKTIMKIFTGRITNWDNAEITLEYGARLPSIPIIPVIHAGGDGSTYYFTRWLAHVFSRQWNAFCDRVHPGITPPCGATEFYPQFGHAQAESGSAAVASYIKATNGAIGYDEYSYSLAAGYPVVKLRNPDGRYVLPLESGVALALTQAVINENPKSPDFLQQNLNKVYTYKNAISYPLSNYSYLIVPRSGTTMPPQFTDAEGQTLSAFVDYLLCGGQKVIGPIGYAPLPVNLVRSGLRQVQLIPGHVPTPTLSACRKSGP